MKPSLHKARISLFDLEGFALIISHKTGVLYHNQVGGTSCAQAEYEGALAPVDFGPVGAKAMAELEFRPGGGSIDHALADELDKIFKSSPTTSFISVDRTRLDDSVESWVHVKLTEIFDNFSQETALRSLFGFSRDIGVLTWPNSD